MKVYVSGPMSGLPALNFPAFHAEADRLRGLGYDVVNPAEIAVEQNGDWQACMRADIKALCDCDAIALLPGWEGSKGAHLELHVAHRLGMLVKVAAEITLTTLLLAACGGGDQEHTDKTIGPPDCRSSPELCR